MARDLGTYHLRVELEDGSGWIQQWNTGSRYTEGKGGESPLTACYIKPTYEDEKDLFHSMVYMYVSGNYSCDCNKKIFQARAYQKPEPEDPSCGESMKLKRLTAITPSGIEIIIHPEDQREDS